MTTRDRLAKLLNEQIPEYKGRAIEWRASGMYPARGAWTHVRMDVQRWQAACYLKGTDKLWGYFGCWETMTACLKAKHMEICEDGWTLTPDRSTK